MRAYFVYLTALAFLLLTECASASDIDWSSDLCAAQKQFFTDQYNKRISPHDLARDIARQNRPVVLMGESHSEGNGPFYADLASALKTAAPDFDCVTFEIDRRFFPQGFVRPRWDLLATRAQSLGLRVFKIDHCLRQFDSGHPWCPDGRNTAMTNKIYTLIKSGICHKLLHIGGLEHLQNMRTGAPPNLADRLQSKGLATYRIAVVDTTLSQSVQAAGLSSWVWGRPDTHQLVCTEQPGTMRTGFAFLNRGVELAAKIPVLYAQGASTGQPWSDYDAALVLGCESEPARCEKMQDGYLAK